MKTFSAVSVSVVFLLLAVSNCSPSTSLPLTGPLALNETEKQGEKVFMQHCERCHPQGEAGLGPAILPVAPNFAKRFQVRHGVGAMPSFSENEISDKELDHLVAYLGKLKKR